ncbi:Protein PDC2 [Phytophthora citrophthora]|uniref:Protein PDC2 n=1 Tax=Phytophthora citrophthora TaxID=4793 RepID=A0AAD9LLN1_9STRA|nr:Protein PDC2 [Phytophthora citrophthora]
MRRLLAKSRSSTYPGSSRYQARTEVSLGNPKAKRGIIQKAMDCPNMMQYELAAWAKSTYKLKKTPPQSTVSDNIKNADVIMSDEYGDGNRYRPLRVTSLPLERTLIEWIQKVESQGVCLSRELIKMNARDIQRECCDARVKRGDEIDRKAYAVDQLLAM